MIICWICRLAEYLTLGLDITVSGGTSWFAVRLWISDLAILLSEWGSLGLAVASFVLFLSWIDRWLPWSHDLISTVFLLFVSLAGNLRPVVPFSYLFMGRLRISEAKNQLMWRNRQWCKIPAFLMLIGKAQIIFKVYICGSKVPSWQW